MTDGFNKWPEEDPPGERLGDDLQRWASNRPGRDYRPPRSPKRNRGLGRALVVLAFVAFMVVLVAAVIGGIRLVQGQPGGETAETTVTTSNGAPGSIVVRSGMGALQVGRMLENAGLVDSAADFVDLVKARGSEDAIKPGTYEFQRGDSLQKIVEALETGAGSTHRVTIPEGLAIGQVGELLEDQGVLDGRAYVELAGKPERFSLPQVGGEVPEVKSLEGLLFPSTYFLTEGDGPIHLIRAQLAAFEAKTAPLPWSNAEVLGVTPYEIVIIASMIEKEASIPEERPKVAAVVYNRLKADMSLGIDATVRYALGKWTGPLTVTDLRVDSPYNTRVLKGLPPGPISSPGLETLRAALEPADVDYLYYVLADTEGNHFFTASYEEFLEAKRNAPPQ